ncbi:segregation and condensation protein B [Caldanaerobius fijiensis DSM 17918]|uniref:Segregation and condensation protein B n=1 Tax=Caldanaerobius fijiensis DSM 17918 TaxID=1121256 RepID=A0A1M4UC33_9THEO|nr:SMC-Scp complex subunit ScpB [Caldanaerobius fijiensis]SHE54216.1 segregation and condensation protein B [Caldanaerobius fijiensis DSM 17918]
MTDDELKGIIEGILFISGSKISKKDLIDFFSLDEKRLNLLIDQINEEAKVKKRGIMISKLNDGYQMCTNPEFHKYISEFYRMEKELELSQAALEVLAIIAYNQPITRQQIEEIRGVRSDKAIATLLDKDLIMEVDRLDTIGHPILYGTTEEFLRCFNLQSIDDLKKLE